MKRRYSLVGLLTILVAVTVWAAIIEVPEAPARMTAVVVGGGSVAAATETRDFRYNVDYSGNTLRAWKTNDTSYVDGTGDYDVDLSSDPGVDSSDAGNGVKFTTWNTHMNFPITSADIFSSSAGLLSFEVYLATSTSAGNTLFLAYQAATNSLQVKVLANNTVQVNHIGDSVNVQVNSTDTISDTTWTTVQVRWSVALNKLSVKIGAGDWVDDADADAVTAFSTEPSEISIGADPNGAGGEDDFYMDNIQIWLTYDGT